VAEPFLEVVPVDIGFPNASLLPDLGKADDGTMYYAFTAHTAVLTSGPPSLYPLADFCNNLYPRKFWARATSVYLTIFQSNL